MTWYTYKNLELNGRLGNQLWQIASTAGRAFKEENGRVAVDPNWTYRKFFSLPEEFYRKLPKHSIDSGLDYMQRYEEISEIDLLVWEWFQPSNLAQNKVLEIYSDVVEVMRRETSVAVHIRRGDYLNHPRLFPIPTSRYYKTALSNIDFSVALVFSDDIDWCEKNIDYFGLQDSNVKFIRGGVTPVEVDQRTKEPTDQFDMFLMSWCDYHVISNSTFSWWGAYLSNNYGVYYPNPWFGQAVVDKGDDADCPLPSGVNWKEIKC